MFRALLFGLLLPFGSQLNKRGGGIIRMSLLGLFRKFIAGELGRDRSRDQNIPGSRIGAVT